MRRSEPLAGLWASLALAILLLVVAGCGAGRNQGASTTSKVTRVSTKATGWLYESTDSALFVSWTERDGELSGVAQAASADEAGKFTARSLRLVGVRSGDSLTLTVDAGALSDSRTWTGRLDGRAVVLSIPLADGTLTEARFEPASIDDFNLAVAQATASAADRAAQRRRLEEAQRQQALDEQAARRAEDLRRALVAAVGDLQSAADDLAAADHFLTPRGSYGSALTELRDRIAELDRKIAAKNDCGTIEVAFGSVEVARGSVEVAHGSWEVATGGLEGETAGVESLVDEVLGLQQRVPRADWPRGLEQALNSGGDALNAVSQAAVAFETQVVTWDSDADRQVGSADQRVTDTCG